MAALLHAAITNVLRDAHVLDSPFDPTPTTSVAFSMATTLPNAPLNPAAGVDGAVFDSYLDAMTSTAAAAIATASAAAVGMAHGGPPEGPKDDDNGECRLLGPFALFVQLALGGLALLSLVYKRWRERPQRPIKIWSFDVSKQVFGSVLVHVANVFMSMMTSGRFSIKVEPVAVASTAVNLLRRIAAGDGDGPPDDGYAPNPCSFYLLNLAIDTTLGIPILILLLRVFTALVAYTPVGQPPESIQSGNYGNPPNAWWWLKQSVIYFCGLFGMKICVLIIFLMLPWISRVGDWALKWTEGNEKVQIVFVMMLFPLIMNALQYYIIDSFIKKQTSQDDYEGGDVRNAGDSYERISDSGSDADDEGHHHRRRRSRSSIQLVDEEADKPAVPVKKTRRPGEEEYNPEVDGDISTVVGSSSSTVKGSVPLELFPKE